MPDPRRRGRPALAPEARRVKRGLSLPPTAWAQLADLQAWWGVSADKLVERLIADAHGDEAAFQSDPDTASERTPPGYVPT